MDWGRIGHSAQRLMANQKGLATDFQWNGKTYWGCRSTMRREDYNSDAGLAGDYAFSLLCPYDEFAGVLPHPRTDKVVVEGVTMRVLGVEVDSVHATVKIHLGGELS